MKKSLTYQSAGVDIDAGNELVNRLKKIVPKTQREGVLGSLGGFGGCFALPSGYQEPVLVSATDGVGTKLRLAIEANQHDTIGIDLVAMCVNDLIVMGAEPLFFLDYYATGALDVDVAEKVVAGIATGCQQANVALIGGETAEMPGMYAKKDYDLAGFCVGIVEKSKIIDPQKIKASDVLIGLLASGPHANGYSLIRHIINENNMQLTTEQQQQLLAPTKIYVKPLLALTKQNLLKGAAHITGGGFIENVPRMLPKGVIANIDYQAWELPEVFQWLKEAGNLSTDTLHRTFNCGIGMVLCVDKNHVNDTLALLKTFNEQAIVIGEISQHD